ncbi:hypothetical protein GGTG_06807 [Gaeumannomyces tritici R3-111a-1]|uniref:Uncharacterized protein n=1 Tax=Gaeumannomyces tritici (strain R3-111a-1) TaxID=644352 RepID=J3NZW0_GAET3|nr:hypothetical protein GGTG_06807 [Gaeumannomyces tritici R3-111a-1]EJT76893.1 hypothetical protein GGTG_06807 [Gaeumannomyces tritici R3-111a-1]
MSTWKAGADDQSHNSPGPTATSTQSRPGTSGTSNVGGTYLVLEVILVSSSLGRDPLLVSQFWQETSTKQTTETPKLVLLCFRKTRGDFTEFCFLCNKWVFDKSEWSDHCRSHFACPDELPVQCDPLLYGGVLATAGYCLFCMADKPLEPELRLRQFLDRGLWKDRVFDHYERYVQAVDDKTLVTCPHPSIRCGGAFDSVKHFEFYFLDAHCRDFVKESTSLELEENNDVKPAPAKRQRKRSAELDREAKVDTYHFVDETVQTACRHRVAAASLPSPFEGHVSPPDSCQIQGWSGDGDARSGDVLLRSPSSLDNDGVEKCFALIDFGILLEQSFPVSFGKGLNLISTYPRAPVGSLRPAPSLRTSSENGGCDAVEAYSPTPGAGLS